MIIELPQELIDTILDHLASKSAPSSLKACSLVCRAWVSRSRWHLFETCILNSRTISVFSHLLRSPDCTFLLHVRTIQSDFTDVPYSKFDHEFAADLRGLVGVCTLEIKFNTATVGGAFFRATFSNITRLVLTGRIAIVPLISTICLFAALQSLQILLTRSRTYTFPACAMPASATPPLGLRHLALCVDSAAPILAWLHTVGHLSEIRSLKLPTIWLHEVPIVNAMLQHHDAAHHHLQRLDIYLTWLIPAPSGSLTLFDLSAFHSLHTLVLRDSTFPGDMLRCITQLAAPSLEHLVFQLDFPSYRYIDWAALDAFLCRYLRFSHLRNVVFVQTISYTDPSEDRFLYKMLPMLAASGVLQTKWLRLFQDWCPP
ncbi:hypothetical protein K438DRAFT_1953148 [Mycena galopus ATCC 62051]|nr:hypothetical protein K438DRAFT_1953148 [Mycena galopus ATCC 62051]